jgi:hypothetical protein
MSREIDPREHGRDRPDLARSDRGGGDQRDAVQQPAHDPLTRDLDLPRGATRERVRRRGWEGELRGSEVHVLASAGAFHVVPIDELRRQEDRPSVHRKDVERLRSEGLLQTMPYVVGRDRTTLVTLTERGRQVLESSRRDGRRDQSFYAGIAKPRELAHDVRVHRAYQESSRQLGERGLSVRRVVLEQELKREYQAFLQAPNRGRSQATGRPQRNAEEVVKWAREHQLPMVDDSVQFPDLRLECERPDGEREIHDIEVMTPHYRGAHAAAKVRAGFTRYGAVGARLSGSGGGARSGHGHRGGLAEEMLS